MNYLLGLIGHPVSHSLSPSMHKAALAHFGMPGDYQLFDIPPETLSQRLKALHDQGLTGFNVTIPHKLSVFSLCQELSPQAANVGAVNVVRFHAGGSMHGHNTDLIGFASALESMLPPQFNQSACVLGAGGAAKAAILALLERGISDLQVVVRNPERAEEMLKSIGQSARSKVQVKLIASENSGTVCGANLIVNTLPIGQTISDIPPWVKTLLALCQAGKSFIFDMVYSPNGNPTPLVALARERNLDACDGAEMLIRQAAFAFQFWTGKMPPLELMRQAFAEQQKINSGR